MEIIRQHFGAGLAGDQQELEWLCCSSCREQQSPAQPCQEPLAGAVSRAVQNVLPLRAALAQPELRLGEVHSGLTPLLSAALGTRETLCWSLVKHNLVSHTANDSPGLHRKGKWGHCQSS